MTQDVVVLRVRVSTPAPHASPPVCQGCDAPLELHQPLPDRPGQILGTCPACGDWHFLHLDDDGHPRRVAHLPLAELAAPARPA
jgi:hypothetical protein